MGDFIYDVAPFISWNSAQNTGLDNSVQLSYSPGFVFYQNHPGLDTFEDNGSFVYALHGARSDLTVTQQYASVQNSAPDQGDLVKTHQYLTTINFEYTLTAKFSITLHAEQEFIDYDQGFSSKQWTGSAYLNYEVMPKTTVGLGGAVGAVDLEGPNQVFEQVNGRVTYSPTDKLKFIGTAGGEFRQTQGSSTTTVTPVFSGSLSYEPWNDTELTGEVYRKYDYSAKFFGQDYLATGFSRDAVADVLPETARLHRGQLRKRSLRGQPERRGERSQLQLLHRPSGARISAHHVVPVERLLSVSPEHFAGTGLFR